MIGSLVSALLVMVQPLPPAQPANGADGYETNGANGAYADDAEIRSAPPEASPPVQSAEDEPEEELVCRRRLAPSERVGERFRSQRVCKTREEWEEGARRR